MWLKRSIFALFIFGVLCLSHQVVFAQDLRQKLKLAQDLERAGRWEAAQVVYEELYRVNPDDVTVFNRLKNIYIINQEYERALQIVEARRQKRPDPNLEVDIGKIYYKMGRRDRALALWESLLHRYPKNQGIYHSVASAMSMERLLDDAIDVYLEGRKKIGKADLFILNLVNLYGARMNYEKSTEELIKYLELHPNHVTIVESYLLRYPMTDRIVKDVEKQMIHIIGSRPDDITFRRVLSSFYLKAGHYEKGLAVAKEMEILTEKNKQGEALFRFGQEAFRSGAPASAVKAYQSILDLNPQFRLTEQVLYGLAQCYEALEEHQEAITAYQRVFDEFAGSRNTTLARQSIYRKGIIQRDDLFDLPGAIETFQILIERFPAHIESFNGRLAMGRCYMAQGDLVGAETIFRETMERIQNKNRTWIRALILLSETLYLKEQFDETLSLLEALSAKDLSPDAIQEPTFNDGLNRRLFIQEHAQRASEQLRYLARGEFLIHQRKFDQALSVLDSLLVTSADDPLVADALYKKGEIQIRLDRLTDGMASFDTLLTRFPNHLLADRALERIGWIHERMGDREKALERYETLLVMYPQSFYIDEVRQRIRDIERENK